MITRLVLNFAGHALFGALIGVRYDAPLAGCVAGFGAHAIVVLVHCFLPDPDGEEP